MLTPSCRGRSRPGLAGWSDCLLSHPASRSQFPNYLPQWATEALLVSMITSWSAAEKALLRGSAAAALLHRYMPANCQLLRGWRTSSPVRQSICCKCNPPFLRLLPPPPAPPRPASADNITRSRKEQEQQQTAAQSASGRLAARQLCCDLVSDRDKNQGRLQAMPDALARPFGGLPFSAAPWGSSAGRMRTSCNVYPQ